MPLKFPSHNKEGNIILISVIGIYLNIYAILFEFVFYFFRALSIPIFDIFHIILFTSWTYDILLTFFIGYDSKKHVIWKLSETFLILVLFSPLFLLLANFLISAAYSELEIGFYLILHYLGLFPISICGLLVNYFLLVSITGKKTLKTRRIEKKSRYNKRRLTSKIFILFGFLFSLSVINGSSNYGAGILAAAAQVSLGLSFSFVAFFLILVKTKLDKIRLTFYSGISIFIIVTCILPLFTMNSAVYAANLEFGKAFGKDWKQEVRPASPYFLEDPYSISKFLLGESPKACIIHKDVLYYENDEIKLYFDAYIPPSDNLPGNYSVLISIHGGGWSLADKGFTNKIQNNKYFAAQGYVVFDVQYGLKNSLPYGMITPEHVKGDFSIDDMVKHLGIFTKFLENNSLDYGVNLDSVFITGGSSGGQLACAVAFAYNHPSYLSYFSQALSIKGIIPLYPANGIATSVLNIPGSIDLVQPEYLVNQSSPPCLLFHGSSDGIVDPSISLSLKKRYIFFNNTKIARIVLPFAGHVLDYYYSGIFNQACLYYMERFLYLFH